MHKDPNNQNNEPILEKARRLARLGEKRHNVVYISPTAGEIQENPPAVSKTELDSEVEKFRKLRQLNRWLATALDRIMDIHMKKANDYATDQNPFINFEEVAETVGTTPDVVFRQFIAVKLARLKNLLTSGKTPRNESVDDSKLDLALYALLYFAYSIKQQEEERK